jgi:CheY-like chemotaxis protein
LGSRVDLLREILAKSVYNLHNEGMVKILIVEDDPLMSRMYQKIFTFDGYEVIMAGDGEEGLEKAKQEKPTIMLLDIMMPKLNGLQVLEKLKMDPDTKAIPVVMLTNLAGTQDAEAALTKGAVKYIVKSEYEPKQISDMVKEIIAGYTRDEVPTSSDK